MARKLTENEKEKLFKAYVNSKMSNQFWQFLENFELDD